MLLLYHKRGVCITGRLKGDLIMDHGSAKIQEKVKTAFPIISLLLTIAALAVTSAYVLYKYTSDRSYRKKWRDYDDCGLA